MSQLKILALVPAAGVGARAVRKDEQSHIPKQYQPILGVPMLCRTVESLLLELRITQVLVVVSPTDHIALELLRPYGQRVKVLAVGGATRMDTVLNGLNESELDEYDWVLVHDAARPGLDKESLQRLLDTCLDDDVGGLLALPVSDTLKKMSMSEQSLAKPRTHTTLSREGVWQAQTPQLFRYYLLKTALQQAYTQNINVTDESSAIEALGFKPILVAGSLLNFKVTWPGDFDLMEKIIHVSK